MGKFTTETEYEDLSLDDILTEFGSGEDFSDPNIEYERPTVSKASTAVKDEELDPRFDVDGRLRGKNSAGSRFDLDQSPAKDYVPPSSETFESVRHAAPVQKGEALLDRLGGVFGKKGKKAKSPLKAQPKYEEEENAEEAEFASKFKNLLRREAKTVEDAAEVQAEDASDFRPMAYFPPNFFEYVTSLFGAALMKFRGFSRHDVAATMLDEEEDLGKEPDMRSAAAYYGSHIRSARLRLRISLYVFLFMLLMSFGLPFPGMLKNLQVNAALLAALQLSMMVLGLDIVTGGIMKLVRLRPGADSLAVICCILSSIDALLVASSKYAVPHPPLCAASSLILFAVMLSSNLSIRAIRKSLSFRKNETLLYGVIGENGVTGKELTLFKTECSFDGYVRRCEEAPPDESAFEKASPFILAFALLFSLIVSLAASDFSDFIYIFSALLCAGVPVCSLLCFAFPFYLGAKKLSANKASVAGWSGTCDIGSSDGIIITDRDIFPPESVSIESIRIFADEDAQKIISYAGSMILNSGCVMSKAFMDELERNECPVLPVELFEPLSGGGFRGLIDGHTVLCGSAELMRLLNVKFPFRLLEKTSVLLAIDGVLFGIFTMKYEADPSIRKALSELMRSGRHPLFALRDFNITPDMLRDAFGLATDGYDFPPYVERFRITDLKGSENRQLAAVIRKEGLVPLTEVAETGRGMYMSARINLLITLVGAVIGMIAVFIRMLTGAMSLGFLLFLMLLFALPVFVISLLI